MKVLFDHNVPKRLRQAISGHEVKLARDMGWEELSNGALLASAESSGFAVMITGDQNLSYQQNLKGRRLALIVLSTNDWNILKHYSKLVITALNAAEPCSFQRVEVPSLRGQVRPPPAF